MYYNFDIFLLYFSIICWVEGCITACWQTPLINSVNWQLHAQPLKPPYRWVSLCHVVFVSGGEQGASRSASGTAHTSLVPLSLSLSLGREDSPTAKLPTSEKTYTHKYIFFLLYKNIFGCTNYIITAEYAHQQMAIYVLCGTILKLTLNKICCRLYGVIHKRNYIKANHTSSPIPPTPAQVVEPQPKPEPAC